jgi:hypothetical protein
LKSSYEKAVIDAESNRSSRIVWMDDYTQIQNERERERERKREKCWRFKMKSRTFVEFDYFQKASTIELIAVDDDVCVDCD